MDKTKTDFATVSAQAENLLCNAIFSSITSSMDFIKLEDFINRCSRRLLGCESIEHASRILASKAVCMYSLTTLDRKLLTKNGTISLIFEILQTLEEK